MTAGPPVSQVGGGDHSMEVRWIFPGRMQTAVTGWFGRFPIETESREDSYLLDPALPGLSVKIRGGMALEIKMYHGNRGILEVADRAVGRMESWQKWSFPIGAPDRSSGRHTSWQPVGKRRSISRFSLAGGQIVTRPSVLDHEPQCNVELTEVSTIGQDWWTLGFEASGPADLLQTTLEATARLVFNQALPGRANPVLDESKSYQRWLSQCPNPNSQAS